MFHRCRLQAGGGRPGGVAEEASADERRRLELFEERLNPVTVRRIKLLSLAAGARCLEIGGGRGSIARWLCEYVGPKGRVTATDLETGFLSELSLPNLDVLRHDVTRDEFPESSFELVHVRAVLMHIADRMATLRRMVSWLAPGGWLLVEEADFGMWMADFDPTWAAHPGAWHEAFPNGSLSQGRAILRQIHRLGLQDIGADAELEHRPAGNYALRVLPAEHGGHIGAPDLRWSADRCGGGQTRGPAGRT